MARATDDPESRDGNAAPEVVATRVARWKAGDPAYLDDETAPDWARRRGWRGLLRRLFGRI